MLLEDAREAEPALAPGLRAVRYDTGRPVPPAAAANAFAERARAAGAEIRVGQAAHVRIEDGRATGVMVDGRHRAFRRRRGRRGPVDAGGARHRLGADLAAVGRRRRRRAGGAAAAHAGGVRHRRAQGQHDGRAVLDRHRARDLGRRLDVPGGRARHARVGAAAAGARAAVPAGAGRRTGARRACLRAAALVRRAAAARRAARDRGLGRGERPRRVGGDARPGFSQARRATGCWGERSSSRRCCAPTASRRSSTCRC